jgi:hypothetical protein
MKRIIALLSFLITIQTLHAQDLRWQQRVEYTMRAALDVKTHRVSATQKLVYYNNSPDTLTTVYYHLYFNAFQPGSMMDERSRAIADPDRRVTDRISKLAENEIGYQKINSLKQDGLDVKHKTEGTLLIVTLPKPLLPKSKTVFDMNFESQVPVQIRRTGRDNKEGISYSMTQWYPKMAEYDYQGWHAYPYIAREFHGVWGDFDVTLVLDPKYIVAATGTLVNANEVGYGYEQPGTKVKRPNGNLVWHFVAKDVIDFAWAADPDYTHDIAQVPNGPALHFFYQKNEKTAESWKKVEDAAVKTFTFLNKTFGKYPHDTYSVIQGGDGGMEYPMCTLILGEGTADGVTGTMIHEVAHSWFQSTLANNEPLYPWMDEGYATFAGSEASAFIRGTQGNPHRGSYQSYFALVSSGLQEPISQHSDHYNTNRAYSTAAYAMGAVFLEQLKYIVGEKSFYTGMRRYYNTYAMRHPEPNDFVRIMEKVSGLQLHWYLRYWTGTTKKIDYGIADVQDTKGSTRITLERKGDFPMPLEVMVTFTDGSQELYYVPMNELLGSKSDEKNGIPRTDTPVWPWVNPTFTWTIPSALSEIATIEIDPSQRMADVARANNVRVINEKK